MQLISETNADSEERPTFYLPHHAVLKQSSLTTKLRVVFDGSAKSSSGVSLNDALMVGLVLQHDLFSIILRFRTYQYVMTADIAKMYRQICVNESDTPLQRILWRTNPNERLKTYELTTVTYGTTSASFLAVRALHQLAREEQSSFPIGSKITLRDFYVDDLLTGANTLEEAQIICNAVYNMLQLGGFELRKWVSNCPDILQTISMNKTEYATVSLDKEENVKTLGLQWNCHLDILKYSVPEYDNTARITKRTILASVSQIFDPLGLISPVIIIAKLLIQQLWQLNLNWDESVPTSVHSQWTRFKQEIEMLKLLEIPRWIAENANVTRRELHSFSDASELAACIYMRTICYQENCTVKLLCAKSRVAPLKNISLPRLELCGALLLARLMNKVKKAIIATIDDIFYWSDSTITISWIKSTSARTWKTFVANRVGEIQDLTDLYKWNHVSTHDNPADIVIRGKPMNIYSDNGTSFVGANRELNELSNIFLNENVHNNIVSSMSNLGINWHFIPARSPHFGGLWEAAVKSAKQCMYKIIKNASLSTDEMITLLAQIEAMLNSRPLTPLSTDPNDTFCLTPAHFLIGDSLNSINVPDMKPVPVNRLSHWQHVEQLRQHFWTRWSKEYLHQLQQRTKWKTKTSSQLKPGQLVIIREDKLPPLRWLLGRVKFIHPGQDGIVRTATVRITAGLIKRASIKLCPLPFETSATDDEQ